MTDYESELQRLESEILYPMSALSAQAALSGDPDRSLRLQFRHASLTGEFAQLKSLESSLDAAIASRHNNSDLLLLKTHICIRLHRFADAHTCLSADNSLYESPQGCLARADLEIQQGRYLVARNLIQRALTEDRTWDALSRFAYLTALNGAFATADDIYREAEEELTAKEMRTFAWLEVQRGIMNFRRGRYTQAMNHYKHANRAYSGYWLVTERIAETLGALGSFNEAIETYTRLNESFPKPEWQHAIGDLYSLSGQHQYAEDWKQKALAGYLDSVDRGEVHYYHLLVDLCCELPAHSHEAVEWARRDIGIRSNYATRADLAWALYRVGELRDAVEWANQAVASGIVCARMYFQAACIYSAAGISDLSRKYSTLSLTTNPAPPKARVSRVLVSMRD